MTSIQDIMTFLKAEKEARAKEKQEDRAEIIKEREEDMGRILEMIKSGVEEEVKAVLKPFQERLGKQENAVKDLTEQLSIIMREMDTMKSAASCQGEPHAGNIYPCLSGVQQSLNGLGAGLPDAGVQEEVWGGGDRSKVGNILHATKNICAAARRIIGLTPIEPRMLDIQIQSYGAQNKEEAMLFEVKNYLKCVMKILPSEIERLDIVKVFHPAKDDWNTLYVELGSDKEVDTVYSHTRRINMQDHRVFPYIPKELYRRYRAAESYMYTVRHENKVKTKQS